MDCFSSASRSTPLTEFLYHHSASSPYLSLFPKQIQYEPLMTGVGWRVVAYETKKSYVP